MSAALNKKLGRREGLRSVLGTMIKTVECYLQEDQVERARLLGYKKTMQELVRQIDTANEDVLKSLEADQIEADVVESFNVILPVNTLEASIECRIEEMAIKERASTISIASIAASSARQTCRLPKMELPVFRGDPLHWQGFWDQYQVSIHENETLSDIDRFNYLKRFLSGEALRSVSGLTLNSGNYRQAIDILKERYGNEQILISAHMEALLKVQKIRHKEDLKGLRKLYSDIQNCIRNLKALKLETPAYGSLLIPMLKEKLPDELLISISRKFGSDLWDLDSLLKYFNDELRAYENCVPVNKTNAEGPRKKESQYTTSGMLVGNERLSCLYCSKGSHSPSQCRTVTNPRVRKDIVSKKGRCFICLGSGHLARECSSSYSCRKCKGRHNISICTFEGNKGAEDRGQTEKDRKEESNGGKQASTSNASHVQAEGGILLQTGKGSVSDVNGSNSSFARILFDTGSQRTYVSEDFCSRLKLKTIRKERVIIRTFGDNSSSVKRLNVVQFKVKKRFEEGFVVCQALSVPMVCSPISNQNVDLASMKYEHLRGLELADSNNGHMGAEVEILVGADYYHQFFTGKYKKGFSGPVASESCLGWVLSGSLGRQVAGSHCNLIETHLLRSLTENVNDDGLRKDLAKFWEIDKVGVKSSDSIEDSVINRFEKEIFHDGTRYVTKLPFKPNHDLLPDNFSVSKRRLASLKKRLESNGILHEYDKVFSDYEREGIIERVPEDSIVKDKGLVHYLPHRAVVRENKETTKIRAVFDASCAVNGPSLNECLYSGPNLLGKIFNILLRFRLNKIAFTSDIKQAFLNIGIHPDHQDFLRFLWYDLNGSDELIVYRFLRVVFGVTSSPFLLNATIRQHLERYRGIDGDFVKRFLEDLYVDDEASGCDSVSEGKEFYTKAVRMMAEAGFDLRKWHSNDKELQRFFEGCDNCLEIETGDDVTFSESQLGEKTQSSNKVLGMDWDKETDSLVFDFEDFLERCSNINLTKRNILSVSASLYDPLGLISPITAWMKTIFQLLCKDNLDWDSEVSSEIKDAWLRFVKVVRSLGKISVDRFVFIPRSEEVQSCELHGFCDSSSEVYSAVVYIRIQTASGVKVSLIASKTKVTPIKALTIPRLELLGCFLLSKLIDELKTAMLKRVRFNRVVCWTDSKVALSWIKGKEKSWKAWVENRVVKIREVVDREDWFHVPGKGNPADIPTRKLNGFEDLLQGCWFQGPSFLTDCEYLSNLLSREFLNSERIETETSETLTEHVNLVENNEQCPDSDNDVPVPTLSNIVDYERVSSLQKLTNTVGYVIRFITNMKKSIRKETPVMDEVLSASELSHALEMIVKDEQTKIRNQSNFKQIQSSMNLFTDTKGILRLRGRFGNASMDYEEKYPILLRESYVTNLFIKESHERVFHHGVESTLAHLRRRYWIAKGRKTIKNLLRKCVICKRFQGKTIAPPASPDLPDFRLNFNAFRTTGLDFAGPLFIKGNNRKDTRKVYILLLTCAGTRSIHLEVCPDMKNPAFIRGFQRFTSRRGIPETVIHDNFKTFKSREVKRFFSCNGINQNFILPASPWWGGMYERLVRTVKTSLKKTLGKSLLTFEELQTVLCQIESFVNSRPLRYVSEDDLTEQLTPNHLIYGRDISTPSNVPTMNEVYEINSNKECSKRVRHLRTLLQHFSKRFSTTYLQELRQNNLYRKGKDSEVKINIGDVMLIKGDNLLPRAEWRTGKVESLVTGKDGKVRGAKLRVLSKTGLLTSIHRPLQKLINLEIDTDQGLQEVRNIEPPKGLLKVAPDEERRERSNRPTRRAAKTADLLRKLREKYI